MHMKSALTALLISVAPAGSLSAAELVVEVTGIRSARGEIGCALFSGDAGFPMNARAARLDWQPARPGTRGARPWCARRDR